MDLVESFSKLALLGSEWVLWLLVVLSVFSIGVMVERLWYFLSTRFETETFQQELEAYLSKRDFDGAEAYCKAHRHFESEMVLKGLAARTRGAHAADEAMSSVLITARGQLERGLVVLGTLGNNAPFIGLFGTVIGIIVAFHDLATNTAEGSAAVMAGISEALVATAVGLLVAIPAVVAFNGFQRVIKSRMNSAEALSKSLQSYLQA